MAIVPYQDEAERLFWTGPSTLRSYAHASRWDVWRAHSMDGNSAVALAKHSPEFGNRLRKQCELYSELLPTQEHYMHDDDGNDVLQRDPHAPLRRCIMQWKAFAGVCSSARAVLYLSGSCAPLTRAIESSLHGSSVAAVEEYNAWLEALEAAVTRIRAERTRKRASPSDVVATTASMHRPQDGTATDSVAAAACATEMATYKRQRTDGPDDADDYQAV